MPYTAIEFKCSIIDTCKIAFPSTVHLSIPRIIG